MWEREAPLDAVVQVLDAAGKGSGGSLFLIGEAGLGKTSLLDRARELAGSRFEVGWARGEAMESSLPFGLLRDALATLGGDHVLEPDEPAPSGADPRSVLFYRALRWLEGRAAGPLLLALDDLHWADPDSLTLLSFLCRRLARLPVAVVGTLRPWPTAAEEMAVRLAQQQAARSERLAPLSDPAARELLAERVGHAVSHEVSERAHDLCGGNPLLLEQVAAAVRRGDSLPGQGTATPGTGLLLLSRFAGLSPAAATYARFASVLGGRFRPRLAAALAGVGDAELDETLRALSSSGLIRAAPPGLLEFVHPLFRQALYDDLGAPVRAHLHARAFRLLVELGLPAEAAEHALRADLVGDAAAASVLGEVGLGALRTGAVESAIRDLEGAARFWVGEPPVGLLLELANAQQMATHGEVARSAYERILARSDLDDRTRSRVLRRLGRALYFSARVGEVESHFEEAERLAAAGSSSEAASVLLEHALTGLQTLGAVHAVELTERARLLVGEADRERARQVDAIGGYVSLIAGDASGLPALEAAAERLRQAGPAAMDGRPFVQETLRSHAFAAIMVERLDVAEAFLDTASRWAEDAGSLEGAIVTAVITCEHRVRTGRLADLPALADRIAIPLDVALLYAGLHRAFYFLHCGRLEESDACWTEAMQIAEARDDYVPLVHLWNQRAHRRLLEGRPELALEDYARIEATFDRAGIGEPCFVHWAAHAIDAYLRVDREADALRLVEWLEGCAEHLPCRWPRIASACGRAGLAERGGDTALAERLFQDALDLHRAVDLPLAQIESLRQYAAFLRRTGHPGRARDRLAEAHALARHCGSVWLGDHLDAEMRSLGNRAGRRPTPPGTLTPKEREIAELAATGLRDQEIADRLFLSTRTVGSHLSRIYRKLDVQSRRELMRRWPVGL